MKSEVQSPSRSGRESSQATVSRQVVAGAMASAAVVRAIGASSETAACRSRHLLLQRRFSAIRTRAAMRRR